MIGFPTDIWTRSLIFQQALIPALFLKGPPGVQQMHIKR